MSGTNEHSRVAIAVMTAREQVAIALRVPTSGTEWIDNMIERKLFIDFTLAQYKAISTDPAPSDHRVLDIQEYLDIALGRAEQGDTEEGKG
jgi:hypothetical protein